MESVSNISYALKTSAPVSLSFDGSMKNDFETSVIFQSSKVSYWKYNIFFDQQFSFSHVLIVEPLTVLVTILLLSHDSDTPEQKHGIHPSVFASDKPKYPGIHLSQFSPSAYSCNYNSQNQFFVFKRIHYLRRSIKNLPYIGNVTHILRQALYHVDHMHTLNNFPPYSRQHIPNISNQ